MTDKYEALLEHLDSCVKELQDLAKKEYQKDILQELTAKYKNAIQTADSIYALEGITEEQIERTDEKLDVVEVLYDKILFYALGVAFDKIEQDEKKQKAIEKKMESQQGLQFTIFSIVIAMISFILNNTKVLSIDGVGLKTVLLVNISFILAVSVLFALIYTFMGYNFEHKKWRNIFLLFFPCLMIVALVLVGILL